MTLYVLCYTQGEDKIRPTAGVYTNPELAAKTADEYAQYLNPEIVREKTIVTSSPDSGHQSRTYLAHESPYIRFDIMPMTLNDPPPKPVPFPGF